MDKKIQLLDCTLRDGGHVNNADFGKDTILSIVKGLSEADVDIIELGFLRNGKFSEDESNYNTITQARENIYHIRKKQQFSVMIRPDWYDITQLESDGAINTIRFAFYYKDIELTRKYCEYVNKLGYRFILNPVNIMGYREKELSELLHIVNDMHPYGVTIVDTFGSIQVDDLERIYDAFERILDPQITIGIHLHENMLSAFQLAQHYLKIKDADRKTIIDGSLLGMGRVPGNLCIEMLMDYMNSLNYGEYNVLPALKVITKYIEPIKQQKYWGYSPAYYFTGRYGIHRSYAEHYLEKANMDLGDIYCILRELSNDVHKTVYSSEYAEEKLNEYLKVR